MGRLLKIALFVSAIVVFATFFMPLKHVIEFDILGVEGSEEFSVTKNWGLIPISARKIAKKEWTTYRLVALGPMFNLRIEFRNLNAPPRMIAIRSGVVRVLSKQLGNDNPVWCDWLNIDSSYYLFEGRFKTTRMDITSDQMSSLRGGYVGWSGYYHLTGC
jgi:hypothetical protein